MVTRRRGVGAWRFMLGTNPDVSPVPFLLQDIIDGNMQTDAWVAGTCRRILASAR